MGHCLPNPQKDRACGAGVRTRQNIHVRGYKEEGTIITLFDRTVLSNLDRFHFVTDAIDRLPQTCRKFATGSRARRRQTN